MSNVFDFKKAVSKGWIVKAEKEGINVIVNITTCRLFVLEEVEYLHRYGAYWSAKGLRDELLNGVSYMGEVFAVRDGLCESTVNKYLNQLYREGRLGDGYNKIIRRVRSDRMGINYNNAEEALKNLGYEKKTLTKPKK